mmetsp:Transcript_20344/g.58983  ORF Transcript_20344/g.58983 Transcript_20344/m.58983 type:complete len:246 (+) Transcript_20344:775-1512(+)
MAHLLVGHHILPSGGPAHLGDQDEHRISEGDACGQRHQHVHVRGPARERFPGLCVELTAEDELHWRRQQDHHQGARVDVPVEASDATQVPPDAGEHDGHQEDQRGGQCAALEVEPERFRVQPRVPCQTAVLWGRAQELVLREELLQSLQNGAGANHLRPVRHPDGAAVEGGRGDHALDLLCRRSELVGRELRRCLEVERRMALLGEHCGALRHQRCHEPDVLDLVAQSIGGHCLPVKHYGRLLEH